MPMIPLDSPAKRESQLLEKLRSSPGLVIQSWPAPDLFALLKSYVGEVAGSGGHVAVLEGFESLDKQPSAPGLGFLAEALVDPDLWYRGNALACPVGFLADALPKPEAADWFDRLRLVLIPVGWQIFHRPYAFELLALSLADRARERDCPLPQWVVVMGPRQSAESAVRDILPLPANHGRPGSPWSEITWPGSPADNIWWTVWTMQNPVQYGAGLDGRAREHYCGVEPVLAHFAGLWNVRNSRLLPHPFVASEDQGEAIQKDRLEKLFVEDEAGIWGATAESEGFVGAVSLRDASGNPWRYLNAAAALGGRDSLFNIVSKQAMLLDYFLANGGYFAYKPFEPLSPKKASADEIPFDTVIQLARRIRIAGRLQIKAVADSLAGAGLLVGGSAVDRLRELFAEHLHPALAKAVTVTRELRWNPKTLGFERLAYVGLGEEDLLSPHVEWLRRFEIRDEAGTVYRRIRADHLLQTYLPGQTCVLDGRAFRVGRILWENRCVLVSHDDTQAEPDYRTVCVATLLTPEDSRTPLNVPCEVTDPVAGFRLECLNYRCEFKIDSLGFLESADHWASPPVEKSTQGLPSRHYRQGRAARLVLRRLDGTSLLSPQAAIALALWLNEAAVALFPETFRFLLAVADVADGDYPQSFPAAKIVPRLEGERRLDNSILVFEDSHSDLGLARAVADRGPFILNLCHDYLSWLLEENTEASRTGLAVALENKLLPTADFFAYGCLARDPALGLEDLCEALQTLEPWFGGQSLRRLRKRGLAEEKGLSLVADAQEAGRFECDFCGLAIVGGEKQTLPGDGRIRCMDCARHGVDRFEQLQPLFKLARRYLQENLKLGLADNLSVALAGQAELARRQGKTFVPTSGFDPRNIGLAVSRSVSGNGSGRHEVWVESGFSPEETAATLAHELTHIWQYNALDHEKMRRDYGNLLFEGHAVWVETRFLQFQIDTRPEPFDPDRLRRALRRVEALIQGDNDYGRGHVLLAELMGGCPADAVAPFQFLARRYPKPA